MKAEEVYRTDEAYRWSKVWHPGHYAWLHGVHRKTGERSVTLLTAAEMLSDFERVEMLKAIEA